MRELTNDEVGLVAGGAIPSQCSATGVTQSMIGGAIGGALAGARAGATAGAVVGGIGVVPGGLLGAVGGALFGGALAGSVTAIGCAIAIGQQESGSSAPVNYNPGQQIFTTSFDPDISFGTLQDFSGYGGDTGGWGDGPPTPGPKLV